MEATLATCLAGSGGTYMILHIYTIFRQKNVKVTKILRLYIIIKYTVQLILIIIVYLLKM